MSNVSPTAFGSAIGLLRDNDNAASLFSIATGVSTLLIFTLQYVIGAGAEP